LSGQLIKGRFGKGERGGGVEGKVRFIRRKQRPKSEKTKKEEDYGKGVSEMKPTDLQ